MSEASSKETNNLSVIRHAFEAFETGDVEALTKTFAPSVYYHFAPHDPFIGEYHGPAAVIDWFGQLARESGGTFRVKPGVMAANGDVVFVAYHATGSRAGKILDTNNVLVFTLVDGHVTEAFLCHGDFPAHAAFWSSPSF